MNKNLREILANDAEDLYLERINEPPRQSANLRSYLRTFKRRAGIIVGLTGLTTLAALMVSLRDPYMYIGGFQLLVEPITSAAKLTEPSTLTRTQGVPNEQLLRLDYPTQVEILRSPGMLLEIAKRVQAKDPTVDPYPLVASLNENLTVERLGDSQSTETKIIQISYQSADPDLVQLVVDAASEKYLEYSIEERKTRIQAGVNFIDEQLPELRTRSSQLQSQRQQLQQQYQLIDPNTRGQEVFTQFHELTNQQLSLQSQLRELKTQQALLQSKLNLTPDEALLASTLSQEPNRAALLSQLREVESQISLLSARFTPEYHVLQELKEQRNNLQALLEQKTQQVLDKESVSVATDSPILGFQDGIRLKLIQQLVDTANQIEVMEIRSQSLAANIKTSQQQAKRFPEVVRQHNNIERQLVLNNQILDQLLLQRETLRVEAAQDNLPWELISSPQLMLDAQGKPEALAPDRKKKLAAGALGGLLLGMATAVFLEKRRNIFSTIADVKDELVLPVLAEIPQDKYLALASPSLVTEFNALTNLAHSLGNSSFQRGFESLYAKLSFVASDSPVRSLVVCSVEPGDGQSTIAIHLAKTAAVAGKRVLLVDANLHKPQIHTMLNLDNYRGLSDLLLDDRFALTEIIQASEMSNLFVLTAGISMDSKRLWSPRMQQLMLILQAKYDLIIYDPPHYFDTADVNFLGSHTDGVLMLVALEKTPQSLFKEAVSQITSFGLPSLGVVVNHPTASVTTPPYSSDFTQDKAIRLEELGQG